MSAATMAIGIAIAAGSVGELSPGPRLTLFSFLAFLSFFGVYHGIRHRKPLHINISEDGQFRLTEVHADRACKRNNQLHMEKDFICTARLAKSSTIWPCLLLLKLHADNGKIVIVPILSDSVSSHSFRALLVACRWIAAHNNLDDEQGSVGIDSRLN